MLIHETHFASVCFVQKLHIFPIWTKVCFSFCFSIRQWWILLLIFHDGCLFVLLTIELASCLFQRATKTATCCIRSNTAHHKEVLTTTIPTSYIFTTGTVVSFCLNCATNPGANLHPEPTEALKNPFLLCTAPCLLGPGPGDLLMRIPHLIIPYLVLFHAKRWEINYRFKARMWKTLLILQVNHS